MAYTQVKVSVDPELAASFKSACAKSGISMASAFTQYMADFCHARIGPTRPEYTTRRLRRAAAAKLVEQLCQIKEAEMRYRDAIPENLQNSSVYDAADETVSLLEEAAEILASAY